MDNWRYLQFLLIAVIAGISILVATENSTTADNNTTSSTANISTTDDTTSMNIPDTNSTNPTTEATTSTNIPDTTGTTPTTEATTFTSIPTTKGNDNPADDSKTITDYIDHYNSLVTFVERDDHSAYSGPTKPEMEINKAWLTINSTVDSAVEIWAQTQECYQCDLVLITNMSGNAVQSLLVNTSHNTDIRLYTNNPGSELEFLCGFNETFREGGDYWVFINNNTEVTCNFLLANDPDVAELAILYAFIGFIVLAVAYVAGKKLVIYLQKAMARKRASMDVTGGSDQDGGVIVMSTKGDKEESSTDISKPEPEKEKKRKRILSLDTFRGFTLALMAFVNYGGGDYWFFEHASWNGINVADLVFPWFVLIMGVSMNFSFKTMFNNGWSYPRIAWKIVWRAAKLFMIGFMLGTHFKSADMTNVRVFGVLQRLALTYLFSALIHMCCSRKADSHQDKKWAVVRDVVLYIPEWLANLAVLALHLSLVYALPVPGCPTGYVGPGGLSEGGKYMNCTGGATRYIDSLVLGNEHMYSDPTCKVVYQTKLHFDPEGILSTLNCIFLCFLGIQYGRILMIYQDHKQRLIRFAIWIVLMAALGALLTKCSRDDGWIPANKNIWSVSYSLLTGSFGYTLLTAMYIVIDVLEVWQGQPFRYPGMNGILIYICHDMFSLTFPVSFEVGEQHWKLLLRHLWGSACWVIVAYWLFVKKIFIAL